MKEILKEKLFGFCDLPHDWDGHDGHAPAYEDVKNAYEFIGMFSDENVLRSAEPMVAGDGDVGFEWHTKKGKIEVGFHSGDISFYGKTVSGEEANGDEKFVKDRIPEKLNKLMNQIVVG